MGAELESQSSDRGEQGKQAGQSPKDSRKWREAQHEAAVPCIAESGQSERGQELCAPWCWA